MRRSSLRTSGAGHGLCEPRNAATVNANVAEPSLAVNAVNAQGVSIWNLDHCRHTNTFRGILHERCNREIGDGNRERKRAHVGYIEAHEARLKLEHEKVDRDEFLSAGALPD